MGLILQPTWPRLGPNLAPSWRPKSIKIHSWRPGAPQETHPHEPKDTQNPSIVALNRFGFDFVRILLHLLASERVKCSGFRLGKTNPSQDQPQYANRYPFLRSKRGLSLSQNGDRCQRLVRRQVHASTQMCCILSGVSFAGMQRISFDLRSRAHCSTV